MLIKKTRILSVFLLFSLMLSGCEKIQSADTVLTSFYPVYLITKEITSGTDIQIENMARPQTGCLHDYQLTTRDRRLMDNSAVFIVNGAGMENSFITEAIDESGIAIVDSSAGIELEKDGGELNSHIWMSPKRAAEQAENICTGLCDIFPQYSETLKKNTESFIADTKKLDVSDSDKKTAVLSFNEAFSYMLEENGCKITSAVEIDENTVPSARELAEMTDKARRDNVKAIFTADDAGVPFAQTVSRELDVPVYILDPLTYAQSESSGYCDTMAKNLSIIREAVK